MIVAASVFLAHFLLVGKVQTNTTLFSAGLVAGASLVMARIIAIPMSNYLGTLVEHAIPYSVISLGGADVKLVASSKNNLLKIVVGGVFKLLVPLVWAC